MWVDIVYFNNQSIIIKIEIIYIKAGHLYQSTLVASSTPVSPSSVPYHVPEFEIIGLHNRNLVAERGSIQPWNQRSEVCIKYLIK